MKDHYFFATHHFPFKSALFALKTSPLFAKLSGFAFPFFIAIVLLTGLGSVQLFDWDEINFAAVSREMIVSGDWLRPTINFQDFYEKPPLFFWLQATAMTVFGIGEYAARLPNALCGLLTIILLYRLGRSRDPDASASLSWLWPLTYIGSILPLLYFQTGIIDPWFNLFTFLCIDQLARPRRATAAPLAGLFLGLALLTKGPAAGLVVALCAAVILLRQHPLWKKRRQLNGLKWWQPALAGLLALIVFSLWLLPDWCYHNGTFTRAFLDYQWRLFSQEDAGHGGFPGYHVVVLLAGCFPAGLLALPRLFRPTGPRSVYERWMVALFWVVLVVFSLVGTKIVHYSSLAYFPLSYLAARQIQHWLETGRPAGSGIVAALLGVGGLWAVASLLLPIIGRDPSWLLPLLKNDPFITAALSTPVEWPFYTLLPGLWLLCILLLCYWRSRSGQSNWAVTLCLGVCIYTFAALYCFPSRILAYSQGAHIAFWQRVGTLKQDKHILVYGFRSYAPYFYAGIRPQQARADNNALLTQPIGWPQYISCKLEDLEKLRATQPDVQEIYRSGGFVFCVRPAAGEPLPELPSLPEE